MQIPVVGFVAAALIAGCGAVQVTSTSELLAPDRATLVVHEPVDAAAATVARIFATRGAILVAQRPYASSGGLELKLAGVRFTGRFHEVDSVFYVRIDPTPDGATVTMLGKPALDHIEPCTNDISFDFSPCGFFDGGVVNPDKLDPAVEANTIASVLAELELDASANTSNAAAIAAANARTVQAAQGAKQQLAACQQQRAEIEARAQQISSPNERGSLLQTLPNCSQM